MNSAIDAAKAAEVHGDDPRADAHPQEERLRIAIVTSIHSDFNVRIWKHATSVAQAGHEVHLICPWAVTPGEVRDGVTFHPFARIETRLQRVWQIPSRILPLVFRLVPRIDLIHFHDLDLLPVLAPLSARRPLVFDVHENYPEEMLVKHWLPPRLRKPLSVLTRWGQLTLALPVRNVVLVVPAQQRSFPSRWFRQVRIANYASRALAEEARDDYERRPDAVIFTGVQNETNGCILLLDIAREVRQLHPKVQFLVSDMFRDDRHRRDYLRQIERRQLDGTVRLVPRVPSHELMTLLNQATIGISPNLRVLKSEIGLPTKLFEYMAAGLPVVTSDLPPQRELIRQTGAGLLAQPEDVQSFVRAIQSLICDRQRARELGRKGRQAILNDYSWESQIPELLEFYLAILKGRGFKGRRVRSASF